MSDDAELNIKPLEKLLKALKRNPPQGRIGVLGNSNGRTDGVTNAFIGTIHEFGTSTMPQRSFLRVPIADHLEKELETSGAFSPDVLKVVVDTNSLKPWLEKVMIVAEAIVAEAFDTSGFGAWPAWSGGYSNASGQLLVDSGQLRNSITSQVVGE